MPGSLSSGRVYRLLNPHNNPGGGHHSSTHLTDGDTEAQGWAWAQSLGPNDLSLDGEVWAVPGDQDHFPPRKVKGQHPPGLPTLAWRCHLRTLCSCPQGS